jgi:uncharacterized membrane protein YhaH (DUF805 family)
MSKPALDDLFTMRGRRNRMSFLWLNLLLAMTFAEGVFIMVLDVEFGWGFNESSVPPFLFAGYIIACSAAVVMAAAQRFHDCGWSGLWALLLCVPYLGALVWVAALLQPGQGGSNHYGADPLRRKR